MNEEQDETQSLSRFYIYNISSGIILSTWICLALGVLKYIGLEGYWLKAVCLGVCACLLMFYYDPYNNFVAHLSYGAGIGICVNINEYALIYVIPCTLIWFYMEEPKTPSNYLADEYR